MFQGFFKKIISYLFGKIIENFPASDVTFNTWNGVFHKTNLIIRSEFIEDLGVALGIPLVLKRGVIGSLDLQIPWNKIWTQPCKIILEDIHILIETVDVYAKSFQKKCQNEKHRKNIKALNKDEVKVFEENNEKMTQKNYLKQLKEVVMANMQLEVKNFHFRFEDNGKILHKTGFSIGCLYESMIFCPSNANFDKNAFIDPEKVRSERVKYNLTEIINFAVYFEYSESASLWVDIPDISSCDYLKFIQHSNNYLRRLLEQKNLNFNNFMIHPLNIRNHKTTTLSGELVNLTTTPQKKNAYLIENIHISLDNEQYRILKELIKFMKWHNQHGTHRKFSPPFLISPRINPVSWWKYAKKAVLYINKKKRQAGRLEYLKKIKNKRNEYIYLYQIKLLYDAEKNEKILKKNKIFETKAFEYQKEGETIQRDLQDLEDILTEYEESFSIDEIVVYRQKAFLLIKDKKNIIQIIEKQNKIAKIVNRSYRIITAFKWMKDKFAKTKQQPLKIDESEYQFIQEFIKENSSFNDFVNQEKFDYIKEITELKAPLCKFELFSTKARSKYSFFIILLQDISLEKRVFFNQEHFVIEIGRIIAEDSLTTINLFHLIFSPKEYSCFQKNYENSLEINHANNDDNDDIFYDQDDFLYKKDFLKLEMTKSNNPTTIKVDLIVKPFEYIFNYEVFTRIKYFINPNLKTMENYNSYTLYNDFLNESKEKAEEFFKEKLKNMLGHELELKLNFILEDSTFIIPDSVSREKTPVLLLNYEDFKGWTPEKDGYKMENFKDSKEKNNFIDPECMYEDLWKIIVETRRFSMKFLTFHESANESTLVKFNLINPMDIKFELQRKFNEYKGLLTSEIQFILQTTEIKLNLPILKEPNFMNILLKFLNFFKKKPKTTNNNRNPTSFKPKPKIKFKGFSSKNYYSLTVSRKSSSRASNDMQNEDEFFEAFDDLEDLLQDSSFYNNNYNNSATIKETQNFKSKTSLKANRIMNYLRNRDIDLVYLQNMLEIKLEIHCPQILIEIHENMINSNYIGSRYEALDISLVFFTKNQENLLKLSLSFKGIAAEIYKFDKLLSLIPQQRPLIQVNESFEETQPQFLQYLNAYTLETAVLIPTVTLQLLDIRENHNKMKSYLKLDIIDIKLAIVKNFERIRDFSIDLKLGMVLSNVSQKNSEKFEPLIEKSSCEIMALYSGYQKKVSISFNEPLLVNLNPHCIEILLILVENVKKRRFNRDELGLENLFSKTSISYTFLNKTGRDLKLWFNERKEDAWELENNQEKFLEIENSYTLSDFFDFSEFKNKQKRRLEPDSRIFFSLAESKQVFSLNLQKNGDIYLDFSRTQKIRVSLAERNGIKSIQISSNISMENKMKCPIELNFRMSYEFLNEESLIFKAEKQVFLPLFKDNYDAFQIRLASFSQGPTSVTSNSRVIDENIETEWSEYGSFSLLLEKNMTFCLKSKVLKPDIEAFEYFYVIVLSEKPAENSNIQLSFLYPTKISNYLPYELKLRIKNVSFSYEELPEKRKERRIDWIHDKNIDFNEIFTFSKEKHEPPPINIKPPSLPFHKEESINIGSNLYSNLFEYNTVISLSLQIPQYPWSEFLEIQGDNDNKEVFYFQNITPSYEQTTILLEKKIEKGINHLIFFSEYWVLNETPFPILTKIKENSYEYPLIKIQDFSNKPLLTTQNMQKGLSNISNITMGKKFSLTTFPKEKNPYYYIDHSDGLEKIFFSFNASYFSSKDLKELLKKQTGALAVFSGNLANLNKKIGFKLENLSSWSDFIEISESKSSVFATSTARNQYNFNFLNVKLPGKFNRTSLILISSKYFLMNMSDFILEVRILEDKEKRNLLKLEKGMIESVYNFKDEDNIRISVRIYKSEYIWTAGFPLRKIGSYNITLRNVFNNQKVILTMNVTTFSSTFVISFENTQSWPPLKLENSTLYHFKLFQSVYQDSSEMLPSHKNIDFAWENPFEANILTISVLTPNRQFIKITDLNLEILKDKKCQLEIFSRHLEESENKIYVDISLESASRFIKFHHNLKKESQAPETDNISIEEKLKVKLFIQKFGLSIIDSSPKEFLYLEITNLQFHLKQMHECYDIRLGVADFQIDVENNRRMDVFFGVPKKLKKVSKKIMIKETFGERMLKLKNFWKNSEEKNYPKYQKFLNFKLKLTNNQKNLYNIKDLQLKILPFAIVFYGKPIDNLFKFYQSILEISKKISQLNLDSNPKNLKNYEEVTEKSLYLDDKSVFDFNKINIMVDSFKISPIEFQTRFENLHYLNETFSFLSMIKVLTLMFNTLGSNRISLPPYDLLNRRLSLNELLHQILFTYKGKFWKFFSAIYSAGVIGNPEKLFKDLGNALKISSFDLIVNTSNTNFSYASYRFLAFFIPRFFQTLTESFQIMWIHLEKGLLYQIEEKKNSLVLEKEGKGRNLTSEVFIRPFKSTGALASNDNNAFHSILQSFFGLAHTILLFPYSQGYIPFMLKNLKRPEEEINDNILQAKRYKRYLNKRTKVLEPYDYDKSKAKNMLIYFGVLKEDVYEEISYVTRISKEILLIILTKNLILLNSQKILLNIQIPFIVSFKCELEKLHIEYLLENEIKNTDSFNNELEEQFLRFSSKELKISLEENKRKELCDKFSEISAQQCLIHNKINIFKL